MYDILISHSLVTSRPIGSLMLHGSTVNCKLWGATPTAWEPCGWRSQVLLVVSIPQSTNLQGFRRCEALAFLAKPSSFYGRERDFSRVRSMILQVLHWDEGSTRAAHCSSGANPTLGPSIGDTHRWVGSSHWIGVRGAETHAMTWTRGETHDMLAIESYLQRCYIVPSSSSVTFWALGSLVRAGAMTVSAPCISL